MAGGLQLPKGLHITGLNGVKKIYKTKKLHQRISLKVLQKMFPGCWGLSYRLESGIEVVLPPNKGYIYPHREWDFKETYMALCDDCKEPDVAPTLEEKLGKFGLKIPENSDFVSSEELSESIFVITSLLIKLDMDRKIFEALHIRSVFDEFKKRYLMKYLPLKPKQTETDHRHQQDTSEDIKAAYRHFYDDEANPSSIVLREAFGQHVDTDTFVRLSSRLYHRSSEIIHIVEEYFDIVHQFSYVKVMVTLLASKSELEARIIESVANLVKKEWFVFRYAILLTNSNKDQR